MELGEGFANARRLDCNGEALILVEPGPVRENKRELEHRCGCYRGCPHPPSLEPRFEPADSTGGCALDRRQDAAGHDRTGHRECRRLQFTLPTEESDKWLW